MSFFKLFSIDTLSPGLTPRYLHGFALFDGHYGSVHGVDLDDTAGEFEGIARRADRDNDARVRNRFDPSEVVRTSRK
jgi:hypothetical protein